MGLFWLIVGCVLWAGVCLGGILHQIERDK